MPSSKLLRSILRNLIQILLRPAQLLLKQDLSNGMNGLGHILDHDPADDLVLLSFRPSSYWPLDIDTFNVDETKP